MAETFILIPGRTSKQGVGISEGKFKENYQSETSILHVDPADMEKLNLSNGDKVKVSNDVGSIEIEVKKAKKDELSPGMLFMAYGDLSCRLMGADTHGTGMPTSKCIDVEMEKIG